MFKKSLLLGISLSVALISGAALAQDPVSIVYIPKNTGNPYFDSLVAGFEDACKELNCEFTMAAPATAEATSQIPFITAQTQRGVDVIAISPNSPDAMNQVLDRARSRGILVLAVNGDLVDNYEHRDAAILPVDFTKTGPGQVELVGSMIGYKGEIAVLSATTDAPDQNTWIAAMVDSLKTNPKYKDMNLVATVYGDDEPQKSTTEAEALLQTYPDLKGIISPTTVGVAAAAQVIQSAGKADEVKLTGLGTPNQMRPFIKDGTVEAVQLWSPYNEGLLAAYFAVGVKNGTIKNEVGATFEVPELGTITIGEHNVMNTQAELTTFNADNIDDFDF
ncbi:substrate-binding domain-containing protein [Devosia rhodophyticola]|uniref:Substrate-binding domain-containing protein n=1 Tax=Devosia rhodophyticola TaxID=3026423 RepID=A0ABY7YZE1_9HYPH|nr:substrate-binding domain-containing protein [Devosia rhodophyticola]WDR06701.1 substrate-binding domain-containing protein [Devosia rhodophyticola]